MGNTESSLDLPQSHYEIKEPKDVEVKEVLEQYLAKVFRKVPQLEPQLQALVTELEPICEYLEYDVATEVTTSGENADALYIMLEGEADLLVPRDGEREDILSLLSQHDVIGDISLCFGKACFHTVIVLENCCVLRIGAEHILKSSLPRLITDQYNLQEWLVFRKQLCVPEMDGADAKAVIRKSIVKMFRQVQMFSNWQSRQLEQLSVLMPEPLMEVFPIDSTIIGIGDKPHALILLVRGDISVKDKSGETILNLVVRRYPFCFAEEGLFDETWVSPFNVFAGSTCLVVRVTMEDIEATSHAWLQTNSDQDTFMPWKTSCDMWKSIQHDRNEQLYKKFPERLQVEIVYRFLRASHVLPLNIYSTRCIYTIAMTGRAVETKSGRLFPKTGEDVALMLVIIGEVGPVSFDALKPSSWNQAEVIDFRSGVKESEVMALTEPCVVVMFMEDDIRRIQAKFFRKNSYV